MMEEGVVTWSSCEWGHQIILERTEVASPEAVTNTFSNLNRDWRHICVASLVKNHRK